MMLPRFFAVVSSLVLLVVFTGGCESLTSLQGERDALYRQNRALQAEKDAIAAENAQLRAQGGGGLAAVPTPRTDLAGGAFPGAVLSLDGAGFAGISGVEVDESTPGEVTVRVPGDVLFGPGQTTLSKASKKTLAKVATALNENYAGRTVVVEGHTDRDPIKKSKWASNEALSEARAQAVADYLAERGVDSGRLSTVGLGASQPRGKNKSKNRRVEIVVR